MKKPELITLAIVAFTFVASIMVYPAMPSMVASHWNMHGNVDGYMPRFWGVFLLPLISLAVFILLWFFVRADPLIKGTKKFKVYPEWVFVIVLGFLGYIQALLILFNLGFNVQMNVALVPAFAALFYSLGHLMQRTPRNYTIGIRTPWTLADDHVWQKTHERGGQVFKLASLIALFGLAFPGFEFYFMFFPVIFAALYSVLYSYIVYREVEREKASGKGKKRK